MVKDRLDIARLRLALCLMGMCYHAPSSIKYVRKEEVMSVKTAIPPNAERGPPFLFLYTVELGQIQVGAGFLPT